MFVDEFENPLRKAEPNLFVHVSRRVNTTPLGTTVNSVCLASMGCRPKGLLGIASLVPAPSLQPPTSKPGTSPSRSWPAWLGFPSDVH